MIRTTHEGIEIRIDLLDTDGIWGGTCVLTFPDRTTETLRIKDRRFSSRDLAIESAVEDARGFIDRRRLYKPRA